MEKSEAIEKRLKRLEELEQLEVDRGRINERTISGIRAEIITLLKIKIEKLQKVGQKFYGRLLFDIHFSFPETWLSSIFLPRHRREPFFTQYIFYHIPY